MTRYFNSADALHTLKKLAYETALNQTDIRVADVFEDIAKNRIETWVDLIPTTDVVEVVRCKDCIYGIPTYIDTSTGEFSDERYCNRHHMCHFWDYYCGDGKRKEGDTE